MSAIAVQPERWSALSDEEVVERVRAGETSLYELLLRRYNQRLYRIVRVILRDDSEAEDVMQEAYVRAFSNLRQFEGRSKFSTWLTRIAIHEALARLRKRKRLESLEPASLERPGLAPVGVVRIPDPEQEASNHELKLVLESAIESLPETYRSIFVLRCVEGLSGEEAAQCLEITEDAAKIRLHRARLLLRKQLQRKLGAAYAEAYSFGFQRCDRVVAAVMQRIQNEIRR